MEADLFSIASTFLMHVGSRHVNIELTAAQKKVLSHPVSKIAILFAMFYISTRSIMWSIILILTYVVIINMLLNEKHPLNVFSQRWLQTEGIIDSKGYPDDNKSPIDIYRENLKKLEGNKPIN